MPLFEFRCEACGQIFEEICGSDHLPECASCGAKTVARLVSMPNPPKKRGFPFKPGPVHPLASRMAGSGGPCAGAGGCGSDD